jgi:homoserine O-acetyltransferase
MVASFTSDWRFSPERSREIVKALVAADKEVVYGEIESVHGHDAFLMLDEPYVNLMRAYLNRVAEEVNA